MNERPIVPYELPIPPELKPESYEKRKFETVFHRLDLTIEFIPGKDKKGAIVRRFINGIPNHDAIVKSIEEKMDLINEVNNNLKKKLRLFRNLDAAYNMMLTSPDDFDEYQSLIPRMVNVKQRLEAITDPESKVKLETEVCNLFSLFSFVYDQ